MQAICPKCALPVSADTNKRFPPWCPKCGTEFKFQPGDSLTGPNTPPQPRKLERSGPRPSDPGLLLPDREQIATTPVAAARSGALFANEPETDREPAPRSPLASFRTPYICPCCACEFVVRPASGDTPSIGENDLARLFTGQRACSCPCPECGAYHPAYLAGVRCAVHLLLASLAMAAVVVLMALGVGPGKPLAGVGMWAVGGVAALVAVGHLLTVWFNPNRDLDANRGDTRWREGKQVQVLAPGDREYTRATTVPGGLGVGGRMALLGVFLAVVVTLSAELLRLAGGTSANEAASQYLFLGWAGVYGGLGLSVMMGLNLLFRSRSQAWVVATPPS